MNKKESESKIYVIVGYKPADEVHGQQDSHIFGFCKTKKEARKQLKLLKDKYIPKHLDYIDVDVISWKFNNNIEDYIKYDKYNLKVAEEIRKDWEKWNKWFKHLTYESISIEEVEELLEESINA